ncbi:T9SS C-terminal target domain-containing protein [Pedobacter sp. BMA]|uniref:T9SS C-terminal target domain-containing protein n=1 Tax=Pedobacter sp. BMA TaxID=1663685 RepID=UPI00064A32D5|nr:T9SS C-terminal target domain-containing protein [Pedobacter sp. BMA]KLT66571.1 hypothetical protein AB669_05165 [Pedobacter sp. BMA]
MFSKLGITALSVLLFCTVACFAQSNVLLPISLKQGSTVKLRANATGADSYQWFRNGEAIAGATLRDYVVSGAGNYSVITLSLGGCSGDPSDEVIVTMQTAVSADISIVKRSEIRQVMNNEAFKYTLLVRNNGQGDATNITVSDALPENLVLVSVDAPGSGTTKYDQSTRTISWNIPALANGQFIDLVINVKATKAGKVVNSATVTISEVDPNPSNNTSTDTKEIIGIKIPNVFTPNGDGKNETFFVERLESYSENQLTIINRWGSTVYEKSGYLNDWTADGLVDGTYFYVLKVKNAASEWEEFKGYVTVIR